MRAVPTTLLASIGTPNVRNSNILIFTLIIICMQAVCVWSICNNHNNMSDVSMRR